MTRMLHGLFRPGMAALAIFATLSACRAIGFGEGMLLGATPASGIAFAAALLLRGSGAAAAGLGFAAAGLVWGLGPATAAIDGAAHGLAALAAAGAMRALARRRAQRSRTSDWLIFLVGVALFTATVAAAAAGAAALRLAGAPFAAPAAAGLAAVFEPLGVLTVCAALFSWREAGAILRDPRPAFAIAAVAAGLIALLQALLALPPGQVSPSGVTLLLAVPFCLLIAMQRRSLDGAALSLVAAQVTLAILLADIGGIVAVEFVAAVLYLNLLVATCQLVHAVNLDRLGALAEVEARKAELERRVAERTARLTTMTEKALAADAAKSRLLATVSHDVRTPLNGVIGMASLVLEADLDSQTRRNVEVIRASGFHLLDVVNRILDFSRLDAGRAAEAGAEPFDLAALFEEVIAEARFLPFAEGPALGWEIAPGLARRRLGDPQALRRVLTNLVGNALRFTDAGSVALSAAGTRDGGLRIEVRDTGVGIPSSEHARIFLPYEQASATGGRRRGGTGLGLAICAELTRRMGGRIGVESAPGAGALFWLELPFPAAPLSASPTPAPRATPATGAAG